MSITRRHFTAVGAASLLLPAALVRAQDRPVDTGGWIRLDTEPYPGKQDDISFISPDIGWYGNGAGKLYRTTDGGGSWTKVAERPGTFIRALGFIDERTGFIGNVGTNYYPGVTDTQPLYRTDDGGVTWTPVMAAGIQQVAGICGIDILPVTRVFQGERRQTHIIHAAGRVGGPAMILKSLDGGTSWTVQDLSAQAGMILDIKFLDARNGFIAAATNSDLEQAEAQILRTADGGRTWTPAYRSGRRFENVWKMSWPSARVGYATVQSYDPSPANTRRVIIKTTDGGRSWRELPLVDLAGTQEFGIGFIDERRGWVGTRERGYETADGGRSWRPIEFGRGVNKIRVIPNGNSHRAFAIGINVARLDI
jgi:photosystem II stability/assembly factor-like uncharacterized protein